MLVSLQKNEWHESFPTICDAGFCWFMGPVGSVCGSFPRNAREPGETYAYNPVQIPRILELLPLLPKAVVATASFAELRGCELRWSGWILLATTWR